MRPEAERARRKGRAYQCLRCERAGSTLVDVKYRVVDHIMKYHLSLDQVPYYCTLCMFRCSEEGQLMGHVTKYRRHQLLMAEKGVTDSTPYLPRNRVPHIIGEADMRLLSQEESQAIFMQRMRLGDTCAQLAESPYQVSSGLDQSDDNLEAFVASLLQPQASTALCQPASARTPNWPVSPLVVPATTPVMAPITALVAPATATVPVAAPVAPATETVVAPAGTSRAVPGVTTIMAPATSVATPLATTTVTAEQATVQVPAGWLTSLLQGNQGPFVLPALTSPPKVSRVPEAPKLETPKLAKVADKSFTCLSAGTPVQDENYDEEEDILPQLLGTTSRMQPTPASTPKPAATMVSSATQTSHTEEEPKWVEPLKVMARMMADNTESNARAIRCLEKSMLSIRDTLDNTNRLIRRVIDADNGNNLKRKNETKENTLKSVLGEVKENKKRKY